MASSARSADALRAQAVRLSVPEATVALDHRGVPALSLHFNVSIDLPEILGRLAELRGPASLMPNQAVLPFAAPMPMPQVFRHEDPGAASSSSSSASSSSSSASHRQLQPAWSEYWKSVKQDSTVVDAAETRQLLESLRRLSEEDKAARAVQ